VRQAERRAGGAGHAAQRRTAARDAADLDHGRRRTDRLESLLGTENPVGPRHAQHARRVVGEGMTVICRGRYASKTDLQRAQAIFRKRWGLRCIPVRRSSFQPVTPTLEQRAADQATSSWKRWPIGVAEWRPSRQLALHAGGAIAARRAAHGPFHRRHPAALARRCPSPRPGCTIGGLLMLEDGRIRSVVWRGRWKTATKISAHLGMGPQQDFRSGGGQRSGD